jgi:hypothetical protein
LWRGGDAVGLFEWLFGKKRGPVASTGPEGRGPALAAKEVRAREEVRVRMSAAEKREAPSDGPRQLPAATPDDNLKRWQASGQARAWVMAHNGRWDHDDWLALLEELARSPFWPMEPDAVGRVLEELKKEQLNGR